MISARDRILKILRECAPGFREDLPILKQIDSLALIQFVDALEAEFQLKILSMELATSAFENVNSVEALIRRKTGADA